jgi:hypothetical protein
MAIDVGIPKRRISAPLVKKGPERSWGLIKRTLVYVNQTIIQQSKMKELQIHAVWKKAKKAIDGACKRI